MSSYPALIIDQSSTWSWADARLISRARSNAPKVRLTGAGKKKVFNVVHKYLSATDLGTLETFYDANRASSGFTFTWSDGAVYNVIFGDKDSIPFTPVSGGIKNTVKVTLLQI